jgi:hypothetical protein
MSKYRIMRTQLDSNLVRMAENMLDCKYLIRTILGVRRNSYTTVPPTLFMTGLMGLLIFESSSSSVLETVNALSIF